MKSSKVVIVHGKGVLNSPGKADQKKLLLMYERGFTSLAGIPSIRESLQSLFSKKEKIGIKINTIAGKMLSSTPDITLPLVELFSRCGFSEKNFLIWDRTNRELKNAGYRLNLSGGGVRIFGTDTDGVGYTSELVAHRNIGSLFSSIQAKIISSSISFAVLKDHGLAGVTASMKNYFGAIHNPNKYHDTNCDPFIAELFETKEIKKKHRVTIIDGLKVQYHRGPSFHSQWAEKKEVLLFSLDAVAADLVGWKIIETLRKAKGLPSLIEEKREPGYLFSAEKLGLGKANIKFIKIIEEEV
ncbi:MAG: DUF362 domain-containing protein [Candidatus Aminicenantales bacterium]